jgi:hypothetical protein
MDKVMNKVGPGGEYKMGKEIKMLHYADDGRR